MAAEAGYPLLPLSFDQLTLGTIVNCTALTSTEEGNCLRGAVLALERALAARRPVGVANLQPGNASSSRTLAQERIYSLPARHPGRESLLTLATLEAKYRVAVFFVLIDARATPMRARIIRNPASYSPIAADTDVFCIGCYGRGCALLTPRVVDEAGLLTISSWPADAHGQNCLLRPDWDSDASEMLTFTRPLSSINAIHWAPAPAPTSTQPLADRLREALRDLPGPERRAMVAAVKEEAQAWTCPFSFPGHQPVDCRGCRPFMTASHVWSRTQGLVQLTQSGVTVAFFGWGKHPIDVSELGVADPSDPHATPPITAVTVTVKHLNNLFLSKS